MFSSARVFTWTKAKRTQFEYAAEPSVRGAYSLYNLHTHFCQLTYAADRERMPPLYMRSVQTKIPFFRWRLKLVQHDSLFTFSFYAKIVLTPWMVLSDNKSSRSSKQTWATVKTVTLTTLVLPHFTSSLFCSESDQSGATNQNIFDWRFEPLERGRIWYR